MMAKTSAIEWCDATHNFWYGCTKVSEGCKNCFAEREMKRFGRDFNTITRAKGFDKPLRWKEPKKILIGSWMDFFHEDADKWRKEAMDIIYATPHHTYLILTKRIERVREVMMDDWWKVCTNAWLGVSAENQKRAHERIPQLLKIPAAVHFVSAEPLLGPIEFDGWLKDFGEGQNFIDWLITGGESDFKNPRPCDLDWVRSIRDECKSAGVAFFHKQHGGSKKINGAWGGRELDGRTWDEFPIEQINETGFFCPKHGTIYTKTDGVPRCLTCNP